MLKIFTIAEELWLCLDDYESGGGFLVCCCRPGLTWDHQQPFAHWEQVPPCNDPISALRQIHRLWRDNCQKNPIVQRLQILLDTFLAESKM